MKLNWFSRSKKEAINDISLKTLEFIFPVIVNYSILEFENKLKVLREKFPNAINSMYLDFDEKYHIISIKLSPHFLKRVGLLSPNFNYLPTNSILHHENFLTIFSPEKVKDKPIKEFKEMFVKEIDKIFNNFKILYALSEELEERKYRGRGIRKKTVTAQQFRLKSSVYR